MSRMSILFMSNKRQSITIDVKSRRLNSGVTRTLIGGGGGGGVYSYIRVLPD